MPELPEVETVCRTLRPLLVGRVIESFTLHEPRLRWVVEPDPISDWVVGREITAIARRGKYIILHVEEGGVLLVHLGMTGVFHVVQGGMPVGSHDHIVFPLAGGSELRFNDVRRFGSVEAVSESALSTHPRLKHLGPEPLGDQFTEQYFFEISRGVKVNIKHFVMDAKRVVGVGNIYAAEALFRAKIHPATPARRLGKVRCERLVVAIQDILQRAIDEGGTTIRDFRNGTGGVGYFGQSLSVYGRTGEPCVRCAKTIRRCVQGGRSTFYCPGCQRG